MGLKIVHTKRSKTQYTKIIINLVLWLTLITTLASIYINFKNGLGLDSIVSSCWEGLKYIIPSYCCKSFFETKEERKNNSIDMEENRK